MASTNRTGRVSAIDYQAGTYEVTYFDRGKSVTRQINAQSNGEYKMPAIGQIVSVSHNSNGAAAATTTGTVWNHTNRPAEGYAGLYRKEYSNTKGQAYERYDANTGVYTQYTNRRTGRNCNGEIYDEAKGAASLIAGGQVQLQSKASSVSVQAAEGAGIAAGAAVDIQAGSYVSIEAAGEISETAGGKRILQVEGEDEEAYAGAVTRVFEDGVRDTVSGTVEAEVEGEVTLRINGAQITITETGEIRITSPTRIELEAPELQITGGSGEVRIGGIELTNHRHEGTGEPQP